MLPATLVVVFGSSLLLSACICRQIVAADKLKFRERGGVHYHLCSHGHNWFGIEGSSHGHTTS